MNSSPASIFFHQGPGSFAEAFLQKIRQRIDLRLQKSPIKDFESIGIVVPTQRLGLWLEAQLVHHYGTMIPPRIIRLGHLLSALDLGDDDTLRVCPPALAQLWLQGIIAEGNFRHLVVEHAQEILVLAKELCENNLSKEFVEHQMSQLPPPGSQSDFAWRLICERCLESLAALQQLDQQLFEKGLCTAEKQQKRMLASLSGDALISAIQNSFEELWWGGLTSINPLWLGLLKTLSGWQGCRFFLDGIDTEMTQGPLAQLCGHLGVEAAKFPISPKTPTPASRQHLQIAYPSIYQECQGALDQAQEWIQQGVPAQKIALLPSSERLYAPLMHALIASRRDFEDINYNLALPLSLSHSWVGRLLGTMMTLQNSLDDYRSWFHACSFFAFDDETGANTPSNALAWQRFWQRMRQQKTLPRMAIEGCAAFTRSNSDLKAWMELFDDHQNINLADGLSRLQQLLHSWPSPTSENDDQLPLRLALEELRRWQQSSQVYSQAVPSKDFKSFVLEVILGSDLRQRGEPLAGLQILSLAEARGFAFSHVVVLGAAQGIYPQPPPQDEIWSEGLKRRLGIPGWRQRQLLEQQNFQLLQRHLSHLIMTYPRTIDAVDYGPSPFLLKARARGEFQVAKAPIRTTTPKANAAHNPLRTDIAGNRWQRRLDPLIVSDSLWQRSQSATSIQHLIECPFRYAMDRLRLRSLRWDHPDTDAALNGQKLHKILEDFFGSQDRRLTPWPPQQVLEQKDFIDIGQQRLSQLCEMHLQGESPESFRQWRDMSFPAWLQHIAQNLPQVAAQPGCFAQKEVELKFFHQGRAPILNLASLRLSFRGNIDSFDDFGAFWLICDYKRSTTPAAISVADGRSPQLSIYSLCLGDAYLERPGVAGYFSIKDGRWTPCIVHRSPPDVAQGLVKKCKTDLTTARQALEDIITWRLDEISGPENLPHLSMAPDTSKCSFCDFEGICRKNDPAWLPATKPQPRLRQRQKDLKQQEPAHET